jgi:hypothetical protein
MRQFVPVKEVIYNMQKYDLLEVSITGKIIGFEFDKPWKNKEGKEFAFNTMYFHASKPSDVSPRGFDCSLSSEQATEFKKDEQKYIGKTLSFVCEARRQKTGGYRFSLIGLSK